MSRSPHQGSDPAGRGRRVGGLALATMLITVLGACGTEPDAHSRSLDPSPPYPAPTYHRSDFATPVNPGSAMTFATPQVGYLVAGQGNSPHLDENLQAAPLDAGFAWPGEALLRTADGGGSWESVLTGTGSDLAGLWGLDVIDEDTVIAVGVTGLQRSEDGGQSWVPLAEPENTHLVATSFETAAHGFGVATEGDLYETTDGGQSWNTVALPDGQPVGSICAESGRLWAVDATGVVHSTAGDADWQVALRTDVPSSFPVWSQITCSGGTYGVAVSGISVGEGPGTTSRKDLVFTASGADGAWSRFLGQDPGQPPPAPLVSSGFGTRVANVPTNAWGVAVAHTDGGSAALISEELAHPNPEAGPGNLVVHGLSATADGSVWVFLTNAALGTAASPSARDVLVRLSPDGSTEVAHQWPITQIEDAR